MVSQSGRTVIFALGLAILAAAGAQTSFAADIVHTQTDQSPIARMVTVPAGATTYYLSGMLAPAAEGDTKTQTVGALGEIKKALAAQNLDMADVVMMHVYLVGDPAKDDKMDFAGMMEGYKQFFGTKEQPNKPSRSTVQVSALAGPGYLVEIEVIAAHK
ncbi:MAG TPA: RidA family protein [Alphaproteobacteria bacterium]|jgi:enamine deaminase RidA (YjgF/YER057c/UK114 family)|nr:RidA family protein [Alphaproteobacteria bacterium]